MTKERVTVYLTSEVAKALHAAALAAGGYGQKSAIVERALRKELGMMTPLSRADTATITSGEWVRDGELIYWWTVTTDKTGDHRFRTVGVESPRFLTDDGPWGGRWAVGSTIRLWDLSFAPVPDGLMAYAQADQGVVLSAIGRVRDQLEPLCGPIAYLVPRAKTRQDTVEPSSAQLAALEAALETLMTRGVETAARQLQDAGLFDRVFRSTEGCPTAPATLTDGAFEWRPQAH